FPLRMTPQLYRNLGNGRFEDMSERAGAPFRIADVGRGAAIGDIDNDGRPDIVVANASGRLRLLVNNVSASATASRNHWLGLRLVGAKTARDMIGARVQVIRRSGPVLRRRARSDGSYASANDPRVLVGLGASAEAPRVRVIWPGGRTEEWTDVVIGR